MKKIITTFAAVVVAASITASAAAATAFHSNYSGTQDIKKGTETVYSTNFMPPAMLALPLVYTPAQRLPSLRFSSPRSPPPQRLPHLFPASNALSQATS